MRGTRVAAAVRRGLNDDAIELALATMQETISPVNRMHLLIGLTAADFRMGRPDAREWLAEAGCLHTATARRTGSSRWRRRPPGIWLCDDPALVTDQVRDVYRRGLEDNPRVHGELSVWLALLGKPVELDHEVPSPYSLDLGGDHLAAAQAWQDLGCPFESAVSLT